MLQPISDGHFTMHILANLLKEYVVITTQLYTTMRTATLTVWETHDQLKTSYNVLKKVHGWKEMKWHWQYRENS